MELVGENLIGKRTKNRSEKKSVLMLRLYNGRIERNTIGRG